MAVRLGKTDDVAALDKTPELKGVTCYFCHAAEEFNGTNNNPLVLQSENVLGAAIRDPIDPGVHRAAYRELQDGSHDIASGMCGPCHDIVALAGAHVERTFREWSQSSFGIGGQTKTSCQACHMKPRDGRAAIVAGKDTPVRQIHDHSMAAVDLALTPFPHTEEQRAKAQALLDDAIDARLCVDGTTVDVGLKNERIGHGFPSGATQERRAWVELTAYANGAVIFESGHVPDGVALAKFNDPKLFLLRDHEKDAAGNPTELFWQAASFESKQLPTGATWTHTKYTMPSVPDRVTMAVKMRPIDHDLLELIEMKDAPVVTFTLAKTRLEWSGGPCTEVPPKAGRLPAGQLREVPPKAGRLPAGQLREVPPKAGQ
jgi:hypothetical protein